MTPRDFIYWLQAYFEIPNHEQPIGLSAAQVKIIRRHLAMLPAARYDHRRLSNPYYGEKYCLWLDDYLKDCEHDLSVAKSLPIQQKLDVLFDHVVAESKAEE